MPLADGGVFHYRSRLQGELRSLMLRPAVPAAVLLQEQDILAGWPSLHAKRAGNLEQRSPKDQPVEAAKRTSDSSSVLEINCFMRPSSYPRVSR